MAPFMPLLLSRFQTQCLSCAICTNVQNSKFKTLKINTQNQIICAYLHPKRRKNGQHPYYHPVACAFFLASSPHFIVFPLVFSDFSRHFPSSVPFTGLTGESRSPRCRWPGGLSPRHRVGPRSLGPDGIGTSGLDDAEEAVEEERRGDGYVGQEAQRWEHPKNLAEKWVTKIPMWKII